MTIRKKLIEVALPLEAISKASAHEKQPGLGAHPRGLHLWWARRPLASARAVIFAQMVDDPSSLPEVFPDEEKQDRERQRLFRIIEDLVLWENSNNERVLKQAREEIRASWRRTCDLRPADKDSEHYCATVLPAFHDPFAGGGALPLEAQRLGLESHAGDLNPVAVLINKALIEIPPKFCGLSAVNPESRRSAAIRPWNGAQGLAEDVRYYGEWMREEAQRRIGHLYPTYPITREMSADRPDLARFVGKSLTVLTWIWVRTVRTPNPAFGGAHVPLASSFMIGSKAGKEAYVTPIIKGNTYDFEVRMGVPKDLEASKRGTTAGKWQAFRCLLSNEPIDYEYIRTEGQAGRLGTRLMAVVAEGVRGRVYLAPTPEMERVAQLAKPSWQPDLEINFHPRDIKTQIYGLTRYSDLFTHRQLAALSTFADLIQEMRLVVASDASPLMVSDARPLSDGGAGPQAYADAIAIYLALAIDRLADYNSSLATWKPSGEQVMQTFKRQALPMTWDFPESNVFASSSICWKNMVKYTAESLEAAVGPATPRAGIAMQEDAAQQTTSRWKVVATDPPYYDNIGYADLSDFFYVWLRRSLRGTLPGLFNTVAVPKQQELVATPYRHGSKEKAEALFLNGMSEAMSRIAEQAHPAFPVCIYYAFKQAEADGEDGSIASTGWDTFLEGVLRAGFSVTGTWPVRTELANKVIGGRANVLATSILLVCRKRAVSAATTTRADFRRLLRQELPAALKALQHGNIAPVDMAQASIGPGMAIFSRHAKVLEADGTPMTVRTALQLINQALDEYLTEQEGEFDGHTRFALTWFETRQYDAGPFGEAETLAKARNVSVSGVAEAGILSSAAGKVRLLRRSELPDDWDPETDKRLTVWEAAQHLIWRLENKGEAAAADLLAHLRATAPPARDLAYRLYTTCERKGWAEEARAYNGLVVAWPELEKLASGLKMAARPKQQDLL